LSDDTFDVFLSHNSKDKPTVRQIAEALRARGLRVWLDEWELPPGRRWQDELEKIIRTVRSSAVLIGKDGLGPWGIPRCGPASKPAASFPVGLVREGDAHGTLQSTDAEGRVTVRLDRAGRWMLRGTDLRRSSKPGTDWESDFTTLTLVAR
jgi:hypothetical protein